MATSTASSDRFSVRRAFRFARNAYRADALRLSGLFVAMLALWALLEVLVVFANRVIGGITGAVISVALHAVYLWATCIPEATLVQVSLDAREGRESRFKDTLREVPLSLKFFGGQLLLVAAVGVGLALAVIPGIYVAVRFQFTLYFIVSRRCAPREAFRLSWRATQGMFWRMFWFDALILAMNLLGASLVGLGLFVTIPISALAAADAFWFLRGEGTASGGLANA